MPLDLVVLGASLGGLHAVSTVLAELPPDFPLPIAIAQHRSASPDGALAGIWQRQCRLRVEEAEDKTPIRPAVVYVAPADYHLLVEAGGSFALSVDAPVMWARPSIDVLFESAAGVCGERLIAVLLTGASADGSRGLQQVKTRGGRTLVQDPATAECRVMPDSALALAPADAVLPLIELARELVRLAADRR
jgi:two-component system chemotaxis response regulator CheB